MVIRMIYNVKFHLKVSCHAHGDETLINHKKVLLFTNFHYHLIPPFLMLMHWNESYEENKMIKVGRAWPSK